MSKAALRVLRSLSLVVVGVAGAVLIAMNQEILESFFTQEGWNRSAPVETVRGFVRHATAKNEGKQAAALLDPEKFEPVIKGARLTAVSQGAGIGRFSLPVARLAPSAQLKGARTELLARDGGSVRVLAQFEDGRWGEYWVKKVNGARVIVRLPDNLQSSPPEREASVY
ncbi:MAG: hypothetical protein ACO1SX_27850 [Actinomycetota bacterium]